MKTVLLSKDPYDLGLTKATETNTGNLVHVEASYSLIKHSGVLQWHEFDKIKKSDADIFIVPCANVWRAGYSLPKEFVDGWIDALEGKTVLAVSLGSDAPLGKPFPFDADFCPNLTRWVLRYDDIWTRGPVTKAVLKKHIGADSVSGCCPTLFRTHTTDLHHMRQGLTRFENRWNAPAYTNQFDHMTINNGTATMAFRIQEYLKERYSKAPLVIQGGRPRLETFITEIYPDTKMSDKNEITFFCLDRWRKFLKEEAFELGIGPRFHSSALSFECGVPTVIVPCDTRSKELADSFCMPQVDFALMEAGADIRVDWSAQQFQENRTQKALEFDAFLANFEVQVKDDVIKCID